MSGCAKRQRGGDDAAPAAPLQLGGATLDAASPEAFYLPRASMALVADCELVVQGGQRLPVHQGHLMAASAVLDAALVGQAKNGAAGSSSGGSCRTQLTAPFSDYSLEEVVLFLRLGVYSPQQCTPAGLAEASTHLPALLRLAHVVEVERLQQAVLAYALNDPGCGVELLVRLINVAGQRCQLDQRGLIGALAARLAASGAISSADAMEPVQELSQQCVPELLAQVWAARRRPHFTWTLQRISQLTGPVGAVFEACGTRWRLELRPRGYYDYDQDDEDGTYMRPEFVSVYIGCLSGLGPAGALATITLLHGEDAAKDDARLVRVPEQLPALFGYDEFRRVFLLEREGYLKDGTLRISAHIQLL